MTEYIITVDEAKAGFDGNMPISAKQEVVRCRDCKHSYLMERNNDSLQDARNRKTR